MTQPDSETRKPPEQRKELLKTTMSKFPGEERRTVEGYCKGLCSDFMLREQMGSIETDWPAV